MIDLLRVKATDLHDCSANTEAAGQQRDVYLSAIAVLRRYVLRITCAVCVLHQTHIAGTVLNMYQDKVSM